MLSVPIWVTLKTQMVYFSAHFRSQKASKLTQQSYKPVIFLTYFRTFFSVYLSIQKKEIKIAIVELSGILETGQSVRQVARQLHIPYATDLKIQRNVIQFYPHKVSCYQQLLQSNAQQILDFALTFSARMNVDDALQWKIFLGR